MAKNTGKVREFCQSRKVGTLNVDVYTKCEQTLSASCDIIVVYTVVLYTFPHRFLPNLQLKIYEI